MVRASLLIPTRNRPELATLAVEAALAGSDDDTEVVVADNGDVPLALSFDDRRLRYLPPAGRPLSMPDNWERALDAARGEWILVLGDKRMLVPGALGALLGLATPDVALIRYEAGTFFQDLSREESRDPARLREAAGTLKWPESPEKHERLGSRQRLATFYSRMSYFFRGYPRRYPTLYAALVRRTVIESARSKSPRFFVGSCPDVASACQVLLSPYGINLPSSLSLTEEQVEYVCRTFAHLVRG